MSERRMRRSSAERKRRKSEQLWLNVDTSWHKYARCSLCDRRILVNNYPDRKVRVRHLRYKKLLICPWCKGRNGRRTADLLIQAVTVAQTATRASHTKKCACEACTLRKFLVESYPAVAKYFNLKKKPGKDEAQKEQG